MRTRLTLTKRLTDDLYVSRSVYPNRYPWPSAASMIVAFLVGAGLFILFCLIFIAVFAP